MDGEQAQAVTDSAGTATPFVSSEEGQDKTSTPTKSKSKKEVNAKKRERKADIPSTTAGMVVEALVKSKERGGLTSRKAIIKYIANVHEKDANVNKFLKTNINKALNKLVDSGRIIRIKGLGANGSFKLAPKPKHPLAAHPRRKLALKFKKPAADKGKPKTDAIAKSNAQEELPQEPEQPIEDAAFPAENEDDTAPPETIPPPAVCDNHIN